MRIKNENGNLLCLPQQQILIGSRETPPAQQINSSPSQQQQQLDRLDQPQQQQQQQQQLDHLTAAVAAAAAAVSMDGVGSQHSNIFNAASMLSTQTIGSGQQQQPSQQSPPPQPQPQHPQPTSVISTVGQVSFFFKFY